MTKRSGSRQPPKRSTRHVALEMDDDDEALYERLAANPPAGVKVTPSYVLRRALALAVERLDETDG